MRKKNGWNERGREREPCESVNENFVVILSVDYGGVRKRERERVSQRYSNGTNDRIKRMGACVSRELYSAAACR